MGRYTRRAEVGKQGVPGSLSFSGTGRTLFYLKAPEGSTTQKLYAHHIERHARAASPAQRTLEPSWDLGTALLLPVTPPLRGRVRSGECQEICKPEHGAGEEDTLSLEEKLRRERARELATGITSYCWDGAARTMLVCVGSLPAYLPAKVCLPFAWAGRAGVAERGETLPAAGIRPRPSHPRTGKQ